jgi:hypothetical protein
MMRFFPIVIFALLSAGALMPTALVPAAWAQTAAAPIDMQLASPDNDSAAAEPPPVTEYNNVPPGLLMSGAIALPHAADDVAPQEDVMTVSDLIAAYNKGQYELVAKHIIPIANSNYPQAEELLGIMYRDGHGVPKDPQNAVLWLTKAAEAGRPLAQHHLAIMSFTGEGMPQDAVKALTWLYIAIAHYPEGAEKKRAVQDRDNVTLQISRRDKARAYDMAHDWLDKHDEGDLLYKSDQK